MYFDDIPPRYAPQEARKVILAEALHLDCPARIRKFLLGDPTVKGRGFQGLQVDFGAEDEEEE